MRALLHLVGYRTGCISGLFVVNKSVILETQVASDWWTMGLVIMQDLCLGKPLLLRGQSERVQTWTMGCSHIESPNHST